MKLRLLFPIHLVFLAALHGCAHPPPPASSAVPPAEPAAASEDAVDLIAEEEEMIMDMESEPELFEDRDGLAALIGQYSGESGSSIPADPDGHTEPLDPSDSAAPVEAPSFSSVAVPSALEISRLSFTECRKLLKDADIRVREPEFETPFVAMPLLLESPVEGVKIAPRWPGKGEPRAAVMDCRLIAGFIPMAREAARRGAVSVLFYSTYRPLQRPEESCPDGKGGKACRHRQDAWKKAESGKLSQHHRALAIDIHGFTMSDGRYITLIDHYERRDGQPPCADNPQTTDGIFLKELACALHEQKAFQVVLTPNSNNAHHNHFHFDITPNASWYIIR